LLEGGLGFDAGGIGVRVAGEFSRKGAKLECATKNGDGRAASVQCGFGHSQSELSPEEGVWEKVDLSVVGG